MSASRSRSGSPLKRSRDEDDGLEATLYVPESKEDDSILPAPSPDMKALKRKSTPLNRVALERDLSPARSSTGSLSDADIATPPAFQSPASAFTALNGIPQPPKKRVKLTFAEKEEKRILKAVRDQEKAGERAQRESERKQKEEEKSRKDAEKEAERNKKEAEKEEKRLLKKAERAEKEKDRKAKEDEKQRKEEEKERMEEERRKKERKQPKLNAFFKMSTVVMKEENPGTSPGPVPEGITQPSLAKSCEKETVLSEYEKNFLPFFIQDNVKIAPITKFERDGRASTVLHDTLDDYVNGHRSLQKKHEFDATRLFNVPTLFLKPRGRRIISVREIMTQILGGAKRPIDLTTDSQNIQIRNIRSLLKTVPFKILAFAEDVRPPYKGTFTMEPKQGVRRLARNPFRRDLPKVNYDYDSEIEWEAEDGEDIESEGEDDEDLVDGEEDLEGFLDDAEADAVNTRKLVMQGDLEPKSTGLCWEDEKRRNSNAKLHHYRMEIIQPPGVRITCPIDLTFNYWDPPKPVGLMEPPRKPLDIMKSTSVGVNSLNNPLKMLGIPDMSKLVTYSSASQVPKKLVPAEDMPAFRQAIGGNELTKLGLIEVLNKQFPKISKSIIKNTLETIAKRVGTKEAEKRWVLINDDKGTSSM